MIFAFDSRSIIFQLIWSWLCYFNKYMRKCICKALCVKRERLLLQKEWNKSVRNELHVPSFNVFARTFGLSLCCVSHLIMCEQPKIAHCCSLRAKRHLHLSRKCGENFCKIAFRDLASQLVRLLFRALGLTGKLYLLKRPFIKNIYMGGFGCWNIRTLWPLAPKISFLLGVIFSFLFLHNIVTVLRFPLTAV